MTGFAHDFSGARWAATKKDYVGHCVNVHGDSLLSAMRELPPGDCVATLSPVLGRWLDREVLPAMVAKIAALPQSETRENWEVGLALFSFSPARRSGTPTDSRDPQRMAKDICRSFPKLRACFMRANESCAKGVLGRCLGHHFTDVKAKIVIVELEGLSIRTWWKIEQVRREVLSEWSAAAASDALAERREAKEKLGSPQSLAQEILGRLPKKLDISNWKTVALYIEVFGGPEGGFANLDDLIGLGVDPSVEEELILQLQSCLDAEEGPNALTDAEREAVHREYIAGIPRGLSSNAFTAAYGVSWPTHRKLLSSALPKLGHCLGHSLGEPQ